MTYRGRTHCCIGNEVLYQILPGNSFQRSQLLPLSVPRAKVLQQRLVSHSAHATSLNTSSYSGFTAQSPRLKKGCGRTAFCTVNLEPKGAAVQGFMWVLMRRHMSAGACFLLLGYGMGVGLSLSEHRASSLRETDYPAM